jgi:hypothetical protein
MGRPEARYRTGRIAQRQLRSSHPLDYLIEKCTSELG